MNSIARSASHCAKQERAELFIDALFQLDNAAHELRDELRQVGGIFVLTATGPEQFGPYVAESVHHLLVFIGCAIVSEASDKMLSAALPGEWPPPPQRGGLHILPDRLFDREECIPHADVGVKAFNDSLTWFGGDLNTLQARREQELVRAVSQLSIQTAAGDNKLDEKNWWHDNAVPRPAEYQYGPITGQKKDICHWLGEKCGPNMRRLDQKARNKIVWVIRRSLNEETG